MGTRYLWKALRQSEYGGVDVVGFFEQKNGVLKGQTLKQFLDNYEDEAAARAAHPDVSENWSSKWTDPQVSLNHLPDDGDY